MRTWWLWTGLVAVGALACEAGGSGPASAPDVATASDVATVQEIHLLADAVMLEQAVGAPGDAGAELAGEPGGVEEDAPNATETPAADATLTDPASDLDPWVPGDAPAPLDAPDAPPSSVGCGPLGTHCPTDEACVDINGDGVFGCAFVDACSPEGALALDSVESVEDLLLQLFGAGKAYVKVRSLVWPGPASCSGNWCAQDDPCCNTCFAQLFAGVKDAGIVLMGKGLAIGCQGNECDLGQGCSGPDGCDLSKVCNPLVPGVVYWIWGGLDLLGTQPEFRVDGFCLAKD